MLNEMGINVVEQEEAGPEEGETEADEAQEEGENEGGGLDAGAARALVDDLPFWTGSFRRSRPGLPGIDTGRRRKCDHVSNPERDPIPRGLATL